MFLPSSITNQLPKGVNPEKVSTYLTVRGGLTSSFGETHLLLSGKQVYAFTRASVVEPFTVLELKPGAPPRYATIKWDDVLLLKDKSGELHRIELSSMNKRDLLRELAELYIQMGAHRDLIDVLEQQLEIEPDRNRKLQIRCELGRLYLTHRNDTESAVDHFQEVLQIRPDHRETIDTLESLLALTPDRIEIARILEEAYANTSRWDKLTTIKRHLIPLQPEASLQKALALELAQLYMLKHSSPADALDAYGMALRYDPADDTARDKVDELGSTLGKWGEVSRIYKAALQHAQRSDDQLFLYQRLADVLENRLSDLGGAEKAYLAILKLDANQLYALERLEDIYRTRERWKALTAVLRVRISRHPDESVKTELLIELGNVLETRLGDLDPAIEAYLGALEYEPNEEDALDGLTRIYEHLERWQLYYDILKKHLSIASDLVSRVDILRRLAQLSEDILDNEEEAITHWTLLLDEVTSDDEAFDRLDALYQKHSRWRDLISLLERRVSTSPTPEVLVDLMKRLGALWHQKLGESQRALSFYRRAVELDPADVTALSALLVIYQKLKNHERLAETIEQLLATQKLNAQRQYPLLTLLGSLYANHLQRPDEAIKAFQKAMMIKRDDGAVLSALEQLLIDNRRWDDAVQVLHAKLDLASSEEDRIAQLTRLANVYERRLGQYQEAADTLYRILEVQPENREASERLEVIYNLTENWTRLADVLMGRHRYERDPERRVHLLERAAHIAAKQCNDPGRALDLLMAHFPDNWGERSMRLELANFAAETQRWDELLDLYEELIAEADAASQRELSAALLETVSDLENAARAPVKPELFLYLAYYFEERSDLERAITFYQKAHRTDRKNEDIIQSLRTHLRMAEQWRPLATLLQQLIEAGERPREEMYRLCTELALIQSQHLNTPEEAQLTQAMAKQYRGKAGLIVFLLIVGIIVGTGAAVYFVFFG